MQTRIAYSSAQSARMLSLIAVIFVGLCSAVQFGSARSSLNQRAFANSGSTSGIEIEGVPPDQARELTLAFTRTAPGGWQQRFEKVHDLLELRINDSSGRLISWPDRGKFGTRQYTWSWRDPVGETRDITPWVGNGDRIKLWAKISKARGGTGDHQCDMDTLYNGVRKQRWEFDEVEDHSIGR